MHILAILTNPAIIGIVALFLSVIWMVRDETDKTRPMLVLALTLNLFFGFLLTFFMSKEGGMLPWKFDYVLEAMDHSLGISAAAIARPLQGFWRTPINVIYQLMVPMMIAWFFVTRTANPRGSVVMAYVAEMIAGPLLYAIVPACGPGYAFRAQWLNPPQVDAIQIKLAGMPNAFPSLHVGTAFVFVLMAPGRFWRAVSLLFLAGTIFATLATGEHYVIDLVAGLVFGSFAACVGYRKTRRALFYLGVGLCWSLAVRFEYRYLISHPLLLGSMTIITVALAAIALFNEWRTPQESRAPEPCAFDAAEPASDL